MEHLLSLGAPYITKLSTNYREPIHLEQRLSLTLRHLATRESQISLKLWLHQCDYEILTHGINFFGDNLFLFKLTLVETNFLLLNKSYQSTPAPPVRT